jgi:hypothetical protein
VTERGPTPTRTDRLVLAVGAASVLVALALRIWHRGVNLPGWDYLLATEGQYLLATRGWWGALRETFVQTRFFFLQPAAYSVPYGLVPGALTLAAPWLFWQPLVVAVLWLVTLSLFLRATGWPLTSARAVGFTLMAWGAWPAGLSYAVEGYPWASCLLPYALALLVVLHPRFRQSVGLTALGAALAYEIPWHTYELGKTVGCVFVLAALLERGVRWPVRALWFLAAVVQISDAYWWHLSTNLRAFSQGNVGAGIGILHAFPRMVAGAVEVFRQVYVTQTMALPILVTAGALSLFVLRRHRLFLTALWLAQVGLVVLLAASGAAGPDPLLRARRFLLVEGMSLVVLLAALHTAGPLWRGSIIALLLVGNAWALRQLAVFMRDAAPLRLSLPAVESGEGVGLIDVPAIAWAEGLAARAAAGERIVLLHSQDCPTEDFGNPVGTLERLYLALGHERFVRSIVAFAAPGCRYVCLPLPPPADFPRIADTLVAGQRVDLDTSCQEKMAAPLAVLQQRFRLAPVGPPGRFAQFILERP